ncbi:chitin synthase-domain-containing protein [Zychaea mexicana]|uniref:chitin synthase-domain-containing protein n=1 Tax=Zychaea mexicana TaxID=64656 RepID=UPI0022FEC270|nr:chitin synthase-domain-containing protein [Zychaea mexicana]KAI9498989.1 chitin synthase-domain-containing protein [Zychaea mexicana]
MRVAALEHLMTLSGGNKKTSRVQQHVQRAFAILGTFGHCRTLGNNNASRFGSHVEIQFNERGRMIGAKFLDYLLERSRITEPGDESMSNFQVLYYLVHDKTLQLGDSNGSQFRYLYKTKDTPLFNSTQEDLLELKSDLKSLGVDKTVWHNMAQILAAILHLGNLQFIGGASMPGSNNNKETSIKNPATLELVALFLGVEPKAIENVLLYQTKMIQRDMTTVVLDAEQASKQRDLLAQTLYSLLFTFVVEAINKKLCKSTFENFISLTDFPGFEAAAKNNGPAISATSFDQFQLNFANEKWHQFMLQHTFNHNIEVYREQAIDRDPATYQSTSAQCIALMLEAATTATAVAPETAPSSAKPRTKTMEPFINKNKQHPCLTIKRPDTFTIQHFTAPSTYNRSQFLDKCNEPTLNADFVSLFRSDDCRNALAQQLFLQKTVNTELKGQAIVAAEQSSKPRRSPSMKRKSNNNKPAAAASEEQQQQKKQQNGPLQPLDDAMDELFKTLQETEVWWVLCLDPNDLHLPSSCDGKKIASQVHMFNILDLAIRARHEYKIKMAITEFGERYADIIQQSTCADLNADLRDMCVAVMGSYNWNTKMMVVGEEQIYLHGYAWMVLENRLRAIEKREQRRARCLAKGVPFGIFIKYMLYFILSCDAGSCAMKGPSSMMDGGSMYSDDNCYTNCYTDTGSVCSGSQACDDTTTTTLTKTPSDKSISNNKKDINKKDNRRKTSKARGIWVFLTWLSTWWIPGILLSSLGGMRRSDIRMAWREKVALCTLIFILCGAMIWFICFFGQLLCQHQDLYTQSELQAHSGKDNAYVAIRGEVFDLTSFAPRHWASEVIPVNALTQYAGQDVSDLFPVQVSALCDGNNAPVPKEVTLETRINITDSNAAYHDFRYFRDDYRPDWYFEQMVYMRKNYRLGFMGYDTEDIKNQASSPVQVGGISTERRWAILHNNVYDMTSYMMGGRGIRGPDQQSADTTAASNSIGADFIDNSITELFRQLAGTDISAHFDALPLDKDKRDRQLTCMRNLFLVGKVDTRNSPKCLFSEYLLLLITVFLCSVILFKFLAALCLTQSNKYDNDEYDKFIVCQVPCYTEGEESLRKTIDSVAALKYDDKRKLLFLIADGMIVGSGNDRSTPRIVLDLLGVDHSYDPEPVSFLSLGQGQQQHNMAKIYSGLYEYAGHVVPYIVVVKVGTPNERHKSGNRGKRDSQMVLMRFLNKVHHDSPMTPLELGIYHELKNVIGVHPSFYEFVLMIDADTEVMPNALSRMVGHFVRDPKIVGLCGETMLSNEKDTWVTMIQVYEYYISHYLSKAFESLFGSVTCLPGCFCMYRIRSTSNKPLLVSHAVINDYAEIYVDTLHKKNLLHLGEDRYLTTLILKHFPNYKTKFTADAACMTNAPDEWPVLLSQRRRWINSTVHNLGELMFLPQLCGFCCFSMRFVVMLDLLSTLVMPAVVCYLGYLIYQLSTSTSQVPLISIITLAGVYGLQAIIFILRRKWEHIGWMIVYILAIPVFSFLVPLYAFWHFDDFSWGNTRIVLGERGQKKAVGPEEGAFDPSTVPTKRWSEYECEEQHWEKDDMSSYCRGSTTDGPGSVVSSSSCRYTQATPSPPAISYTPRQRRSNNGSNNNRSSSIIPSESEIVEEIKRILDTNDLMLLTKKQVRDTLSDTFGMDMNYKRDFINKSIEQSLAERL